MTSIEHLNGTDGQVPGQLFRHGFLGMTHAAWNALAQVGLSPHDLIVRHVAGDFGDLDDEDKQSNTDAVASGGRVFSAYEIASGVRVWVITEADRSSTTLLLPSEY